MRNDGGTVRDATRSAVGDEQTYAIIGAAQAVHRVLGPGFLEATYEAALKHELAKNDVLFESQPEFPVCYDGIVCGTYRPDLVAFDRIIIELKACDALAPVHVTQALSYLKATGLPVALLINFGTPSLQHRRFDNKHLKD